MIKHLENKMEKMQESINKDLKELKNKHTEANNTITEIKNTLEGINRRISEVEEWISELEYKMLVITSEEQNKVKNKKENCWGQYQRPLVPEEEEKKKEYEKMFEEIIVEHFPNMEKEIVKSKRHKKSNTG